MDGQPRFHPRSQEQKAAVPVVVSAEVCRPGLQLDNECWGRV